MKNKKRKTVPFRLRWPFFFILATRLMTLFNRVPYSWKLSLFFFNFTLGLITIGPLDFGACYETILGF
jgi:hypothetical protein